MTSPSPDPTLNEVDFCARVASDANAIFARGDASCPFVEARIEGLGSTRSDRARKDLRFYGPDSRLLLTGEVKLPGGVGAFDAALVKDAGEKAEDAGVKFFFTWDVNTFVLWDRSLWQVPLLERRVRVWQLRRELTTTRELARPETLDFITTRFLPDLIRDLSDIVSGRRRDWSLPPDEVFLRSLESHLDWPIGLLREYLHAGAESDRGFDARLQEWMVSQDRVFLRHRPDEWREAVDNAARTLAYVWTNRFIFYKALRTRFPDLPALELGPSIRTPEKALRRLREIFQRATERSGDYESLLFPEAKDWANDLIFEPPGAIDAWRGFLRGIESVDFRDVKSDVVGLIFQKLVDPEERHKFGQHFTGPDAVDLINAFCIRKADAAVLDPACGSGSFLVRAYYRKRSMDPERSHLAMLGDLFGCDVALYPAHLATLNLAAREINDEANYPRIERRDFFEVMPGKPFCEIPERGSPRKVPVRLPELDAVVGNPPYVRQEKVAGPKKARMGRLMESAFSGTRFTGRADLHCYFWPHAAQFLKEGAWFGFLTSSQWLDVDYGFALQRWMLRHFKVVAIMESAAERWFPDARVKTCIAILQRCDDERERMENPVRFVRFDRPLADLIGVPPTGGAEDDAEEREALRHAAADRLRDAIEHTTRDVHDNRWRVLVKRQGDLWEDGVRAGRVLKDAPGESDEEEGEEDAREEETTGVASGSPETEAIHRTGGDYVAGKWGRYLRAPALYFEIMSRFRDRFVRMGDIVDVRFGVKTGCDAFFMPHDATEAMLAEFPEEKEFRKMTAAARRDVVAGKYRIVKDGAGTYHPIEPRFLAPEVHSLMKLDRPVVRARDLDRVVLMVGDSKASLRGTNALRYLKYGEQAIYVSGKTRSVPVPQRSTCAARHPWYDLTGLVKSCFAFWPKGAQYRHAVVHNPENLIGNCRLNCLSAKVGDKWDPTAFTAVLNSTLVALFTQFHGRYTGAEGALEMMVLDVNLVDVPDPRRMSKGIASRLKSAFRSICRRPTGDLVEPALKDCHSYARARELAERPITPSSLPDELRQADRRELDDAVFELLGVADANERARLVDRLHEATAEHFRAIRVTEIQKMEDRAKGSGPRFDVSDQAADAWDAIDLADLAPLAEWVRDRSTGELEEFEIPAERPVVLAENGLFKENAVFFGARRLLHVVCGSRSQARLLARMAELGVVGVAHLPSDEAVAEDVLKELERRHDAVARKLRELAASRTSDDAAREDVFKLLNRWYVRGRTTGS